MKSCLFITYEFIDGTVFSGNGVLSRTYANEMGSYPSCLHHNINRLDVLCAYPAAEGELTDENEHMKIKSGWIEHQQPKSFSTEQQQDSVLESPIYAAVPVPPAKWKRLDIGCPVEDFARGVVNFVSQRQKDIRLAENDDKDNIHVGQQIYRAFDQIRNTRKDVDKTNSDNTYDYIFYVDWHGYYAWSSLMTNLSSHSFPTNSSTKLIFMNFRIFANKILFSSAAKQNSSRETWSEDHKKRQ